MIIIGKVAILAGALSIFVIMNIKKTVLEKKQDRLIKKLLNPSKKKKQQKSFELEIQFLRKKSYLDFLNSKYWAHVRQLVLKRDCFECIICHSKIDLHVHHDNYKNHFNEHNHLEDLMTLCRICHKEHHYAQ